jgi:hypothetical protein
MIIKNKKENDAAAKKPVTAADGVLASLPAHLQWNQLYEMLIILV